MTILRKRLLTALAFSALFVGAISCESTTPDAISGMGGGTDPGTGGGTGGDPQPQACEGSVNTVQFTAASDYLLGRSGTCSNVFDADFNVSDSVAAEDKVIGVGTKNTLKVSNLGTTSELFLANYAKLPAKANVTNVQTLELASPLPANPAGYDFSALYTFADNGISLVQLDDIGSFGGVSLAGKITTGDGQGLSVAKASGVAAEGLITWEASNLDAALNLTFNGFQGAPGAVPKNFDVTGAAATTINIASNTEANAIGAFNTPNNVTTLKITGDQALRLGKRDGSNTLNPAILTVDASAATGRVELAPVLAATTNVQMGSAAKNIVHIGDLSNAPSTVTLTGGGSDILAVSANSATPVNINPGITGFTGLQFDSASTAITSLPSWATNLYFNTIDLVAISNVPATVTTVNFPIAYVTASLSAAGSGSVLTVNVGTPDSTTAVTLDSLTLDNYGTVTVNSGGIAANTVTAMPQTTALSAMTLTGTQGLTVSAVASTYNGPIDASALAAPLTLDMSAVTAGITVTAPSRDYASLVTIPVNTALGNTFVLGAGTGSAVNTLVFTATAFAAVAAQTTLGMKVTNFKSTDVIRCSEAPTFVSGAISTLTVAGQTVSGAFAGVAGQVNWFVSGPHTYVVFGSSNAASYNIVELTEYTGGLTAANFST